MIDQRFQLDKIITIEFGVKSRDGKFYTVPVDKSIQEVLEEAVKQTVEDMSVIPGDWERYSVSEDYGSPKKIASPMSDELMEPFRRLFSIGAFEDDIEILKKPDKLEYYFAVLRDENSNKLIGIRQAQRFKGIVAERSVLVRWSDSTLKLISDSVFRIDAEFDLVFDSEWILVRNHRALERVADLSRRVAAAAKQKIEAIEKRISFVDLSGIKADIGSHPRSARLANSISRRLDLDKIQMSQVESMAAAQKIPLLKDGHGRIRPRVADRHKFLEIFDDRRYVSKITGEDIPFLARSRIKAIEGT